MKIGFFGDSFCACNTKMFWRGETYIKKLQNHYSADIVNLGERGSSIWDLLLIQLDPFIKTNTLPDICIFVWTEPDRIFHRTIRNINSGSSRTYKHKNKIWETANNYYDHLLDRDLSELQYVAGLQYIDNNILSKFPSTTKIVHLWSFGKSMHWNDEGVKPENLQYLHTWKHGVEIRPSMMTVALEDGVTLYEFTISDVPNHLKTESMNNKMFEIIKSAIDSQ
jgi:hypothetical protein